jgi:hypothetical protein
MSSICAQYKTDRQDMTDVLFNVELNTHKPMSYENSGFQHKVDIIVTT